MIVRLYHIPAQETFKGFIYSLQDIMLCILGVSFIRISTSANFTDKTSAVKLLVVFQQACILFPFTPPKRAVPLQTWAVIALQRPPPPPLFPPPPHGGIMLLPTVSAQCGCHFFFQNKETTLSVGLASKI